MVLSFTRGENKFDRSAIDLDVQVKHMDLSIDSKQFSDLLDFGKFQNYSVLYGRCNKEVLEHSSIHNHAFPSKNDVDNIENCIFESSLMKKL